MSQASQIAAPTVSSLPGVNLAGFFAAVDSMLRLQWKAEGLAQAEFPKYIKEAPAVRVLDPDSPLALITYRVEKTEPATLSNEREAKAYNFRLRDSRPDPDHAGYLMKIYGWWEEVEVAFTITSRTNDRADQLAEWFHRTLLLYAYELRYFASRGVQVFRFVGREKDRIDNATARELYQRELHYRFRLDWTHTVSDHLLEQIRLSVGAYGEPAESFPITEQSET